MSDTPQRFSEREMARILKLASSTGGSLPAVTRSDGFTVSEIESIAREAGLDASGIAAAAAAVAMERTGNDSGVLQLRHQVPGVVSSRDYGRLADAIGDAAGEPGTRNAAFGSLEWETAPGARQLQVTITPGEESTSIRVHADASALKGLCYVASMGGALALGGITGAITEPASALLGIGIMASAASVGVATGWAAWRMQARRIRERAAAVFQAATTAAAELAASRRDDGRDEAGAQPPSTGSQDSR